LATVAREDFAALSLPGRDNTAVGYYFSLHDKLVLLSGDALIEADDATLSRLSRQLSEERWDARRFSESLDALSKLKPDIWLSAHPLFGRSANLYDNEWMGTILDNRLLLRRREESR
jgi:hypothetical protein